MGPDPQLTIETVRAMVMAPTTHRKEGEGPPTKATTRGSEKKGAGDQDQIQQTPWMKSQKTHLKRKLQTTWRSYLGPGTFHPTTLKKLRALVLLNLLRWALLWPGLKK